MYSSMTEDKTNGINDAMQQSRHTPWQRIGVVFITCMAFMTPALAANKDVVFSIPAQSLDRALTVFAEQSDWQLFYSAELVEGLTSQGLSGVHHREEGLKHLLDGTGLHFRMTDPQTVTLAKGTKPSASTGLFAAATASESESPLTTNPTQTSKAEPIKVPEIEIKTTLGSRKIDAPLSNVPGSITALKRKEVQKQLAISRRTVDILKRTVPGFNPTNNGVRQIRGRTAQVFINGVPMNEQLRASGGSDLNQLRADHFAGIEVARGANAAYGFGSPGGIIALQTPRAQTEELALRTTVRESFNPHHGNRSHRTSLYQSASQVVGKFDFHVAGSITYDGFDYDPEGNPSSNFSDAPTFGGNGEEMIYNFDTSLGLDLGKAGRFRFTGTFNYADLLTITGTNSGVYRGSFGSLFAEPGGDDFQRSFTLNFSYENADIFGSSLKIETLHSSNWQVKETTNSGFSPLVRDEMDNEYVGVRSAVNTPLNVANLFSGSSVTYGFDYLRNNLFRPRFNLESGGVFDFISPDVTLESYAPHGQLEIPFSNFLLTGGARHEIYRGHVETAVGGTGAIQGGDIDGFSLTLYNAGLVYFLNDNIELYGTFSQGAEITQLGRAARSASTADQVDPEPAKSNQYEIGMRGAWPDFTVSLAAYFTESDLISSLTCDGVNPCTPLREARKFWGVEVKADRRINDHWGVSGVLSWQDGIREPSPGVTRRISSSTVPPVLITANVDYSPFRWWRNTLQFDYWGSRDPFGGSTAFSEGRVEDQLLVNLFAEFDAGPGHLQVGVDNLLNTEFVSIGGQASNSGFSWVPEEGTRISLAYTLLWGKASDLFTK